jgi:hypothetical protein
VLALFAALVYLDARQAQGWPTLEARVIQSQVDVEKKASGFSRRTKFQDYYTAAIHYEYVVNGQRFTGNRIGLDGSRSSGFDRDDAERWVRQYPVGAAVKIHYSPHDPKKSVIDPSPDTMGLTLMFGFSVLAIPVGLVLRRLGRQMQPAELLAGPVSQRAPASARPQVSTSAPPPVAAQGDHGPLLQQAPLAEARPTHWLIRTITIVAGLVIFFFGCLALNVSVKLFLRAGDAQGHGAISIIVHVVMIGIMAGVTLLGAFLVWKGLKRRSRSLRFQG